MPGRFNSRSKTRFGVTGLPSGYDSIAAPEEYSIPSVGIEDVDAALFTLFDKDIPLTVTTSLDGKAVAKKVPVIFASAEKWALSKLQSGVRDKTGSLILPLITIVRTSITQSPNEDIVGRGINQQTGELTVRRRLDNSDRGYQRLLNRYFLSNQDGTSVSRTAAAEGTDTVGTGRKIGDLYEQPLTIDGGLLSSNRKNNVFETIVVPAPQFFTATYDVTLWCQYSTQMFQMLEHIISSFLPQGNAWKLDTPKGYWFIATVDSNLYNSETNADNMSSEERLIKYRFTIKVPAYIFATKIPGAPVPLKRYVSSPSISFEIGTGADPNETLAGDGVDDPFLGADDPTLLLTNEVSSRDDQRVAGSTKLYPNSSVSSPHDPARRGRDPSKYKKIKVTLPNGDIAYQYVKVVKENRFTGETVFRSGFDLGSLTFEVDQE